LIIVIPAHAEIQGQVAEEFPIVLHKGAVVVVAEAYDIVLGGEPALRVEEVNAGIDGAEGSEIVHGGE